MWFPTLQDEDFSFAPGERENMMDRLAAKLSKTRAELESLFAELQLY